MIVHWTASVIETRLEDAASTLRRLPPVKVAGYFSVWPHILHDADDKRDWEVEVRRIGTPSAKAISRMEETFNWFYWLTAEENRLLWLRANRTPWKVISRYMGCDRTTAWRRWIFALSAIAYKLNAS